MWNDLYETSTHAWIYYSQQTDRCPEIYSFSEQDLCLRIWGIIRIIICSISFINFCYVFEYLFSLRHVQLEYMYVPAFRLLCALLIIKEKNLGRYKAEIPVKILGF